MTKREKVLELLTIIGLDDAAKVAGVDNVVESYRKACGEKALEESTAHALKILDENLRKHTPALIDAFARIYEHVYSEELIDQMLAFHRSELGQMLNSTGPTVAATVIKAADDWQNCVIRDLDDEVKIAIGATVPTETPVPSAP